MSEFAIGEKDNPYAEYRDLNFEHLRPELEASLDAWRSKRGAVGSNAVRPGFDPVFIYTFYFIQNNEGLTNDEMVAEEDQHRPEGCDRHLASRRRAKGPDSLNLPGDVGRAQNPGKSPGLPAGGDARNSAGAR